MNRNLTNILLVCFSLLALDLSSGVFAPKSETQAASIVHPSFAESVPGGYSPISVKDKSVIAAAKFAVLEQSKKGKPIKLSSITTAHSQVVAGMNYRLELKVEEAGVARVAIATVYQDLKQVLLLTDWTWK